MKLYAKCDEIKKNYYGVDFDHVNSETDLQHVYMYMVFPRVRFYQTIEM